jgi:hypothetical protein
MHGARRNGFQRLVSMYHDAVMDRAADWVGNDSLLSSTDSGTLPVCRI